MMHAAAATTIACDPPIVVHVTDPDARWDSYVEQHPAASGYHRSAWAGVITRASGHTCRYLLAESEGRVVGVLPLVLFKSWLFGHFLVSMPFLNYGGVLADTLEAETALLDAAIKEARRARASHIELRHTRQVFPTLSSKRHKVAMVLHLQTTAERQWHMLNRKVRNQVRKAKKNSLEVSQGQSDLLPAFYKVFARNMRDLGTPVYSKQFFQEILAAFPETTRIFCVSSGQLTMAASFVYWHGKTLEVPWASSDRRFNHLCPNMLLYWEMLRFAIELACERFDFGRCTLGEGTYKFKQQWGATPQQLVWEYWSRDSNTLPDVSPANPKYKLAIHSWKRLPVGLTKVLGPRIIRNIP